MAELKTSKASLPDFFAMASSAPYMIRSATDFLPRVIRTFMNLATSSLLNFGSGRISRLGTSLRRGMEYSDWNGDQEKGWRASRPAAGYAALGLFAPYFERDCFRSLTPAVSREPRTMW